MALPLLLLLQKISTQSQATFTVSHLGFSLACQSHCNEIWRVPASHPLWLPSISMPILAPFHFNANLTYITKARVTRQNIQNAFFIYSHHMITIQGLETSCTAFKSSFHSAQTHYAHNGAVYCMHQAAAHNRAVQYTSYVIFIFFVLVQHIMYKSLFHVYTHTPTASTSKRTLICNNVKLVM